MGQRERSPFQLAILSSIYRDLSLPPEPFIVASDLSCSKAIGHSTPLFRDHYVFLGTSQVYSILIYLTVVIISEFVKSRPEAVPSVVAVACPLAHSRNGKISCHNVLSAQY
jgi:hypothetical protein